MKTLEAKAYDGDLARQIIENPVYQAIMGDMETEVINLWMQSESQEDREKCHYYLKAIKRFQQSIRTTLETGKLAVVEIEHKRKRQLMQKD